MKVIKAPPEFQKFNATCRACKTEVQIESISDLNVRHYEGDMREPGYTTYFFDCPTCGDEAGVEESDIKPAHLRSNIRVKR